MYAWSSAGISGLRTALAEEKMLETEKPLRTQHQ